MFGSRRIRIVVFMAGYFLIEQSVASELSGSVSTDVTYFDNVYSESFDKQEDYKERVGAQFQWVERSKKLTADASISVDAERYENQSFDDQTSLTSGFGLFQLDVIESFLNWSLSFSRADVLSDSAETENPDTREYRNILRTGPLVSYSISRSSSLSFGANYISVENSDSEVSDSQRVDANLRLSHIYNSVTSLFIEGRAEETIEADNGDVSNYRATGGIVRRFVDGEISFELGQQEVESGSFNGETNTYFNLAITRNDILGHNFLLEYGEEVSDSSIGFESDEFTIDDDNLISVSSTNDVVERKSLSLSFDKDLDAFSYSIQVQSQENNFKLSDSEERNSSARFRISPKIGKSIQLNLTYSYGVQDFGARASLGEDVLQDYSVAASYQFTKDFFVNTSLEYSKQENDENAEREFDEAQVVLGLRWQFL